MKSIFNLSFYDEKLENLRTLIEEYLLNKDRNKDSMSIFTPNVDHIITVYEDEKVREAYQKSKLIVADGWPIQFVSKIVKKDLYQITGVDLMEQLLLLANDLSLNVYFLGAEDKTLKMINENISIKYPSINSISSHNGFFAEYENNKILEDIIQKGTDILFVGMGHPKQEMWINMHCDEIKSCVIIAVGGAFKIFSNEVKRAPIVVRKLKLEWFWRFLNEPKRLFYRYFIRYPKFILIALKEIFSRG